MIIQTNLTGNGSRPSRRTGGLSMFLLALVGTAVLSCDAQAPPKPASASSASTETTTAKPPWERIVMVGASATAGFTESEPLGGPTTPQYRLSRYLDAAVLVRHEPVQNLAHTMFFVDAQATGRDQIDRALQARPTLDRKSVV